ncbi:hypothetical protein [Brevibacillus nitrificans]|uniref:hypothetical protein n=1 Tax=Brevibacillus nitrificans TaxID=651560 RepID=UPI00260F5800|nr:hypothetical protein [Brevibacillus nitrificans]MED1796955.1 hypothetical protein [Brevibacillus nitrificans]
MVGESGEQDDSGQVGKGYEEACCIDPLFQLPASPFSEMTTEWLGLIDMETKTPRLSKKAYLKGESYDH